MRKSSEASKGVCYRIKQPAKSNNAKGFWPNSIQRPLVGYPESNLWSGLPTKKEKGHLIAGYPEGGCLWRFMINCMDKISSVCTEGLWGIRLPSNQHRVDSTDRERTWASIMGYSSLCRQQWDAGGKKPKCLLKSSRAEKKGGRSVSHWNNELFFDHGVENRETDGEDTEIWFNLNMRELKEDKSWLTSVNANANILGGNQQMCEKRATILLL